MNSERLLGQKNTNAAFEQCLSLLTSHERTIFTVAVVEAIEDTEVTSSNSRQQERIEDACTIGIVKGAFQSLLQSRRIHV